MIAVNNSGFAASSGNCSPVSLIVSSLMMTSNVRLENLWRRLSLSGDASVWHARLLRCYAEPQRAYHTLQHLEECLLLLDDAKATGLIAKPDLIEMALWFHDAVYNPQGSENEELSAQMALEALDQMMRGSSTLISRSSRSRWSVCWNMSGRFVRSMRG
jgi:predicted metal-dependent HD superfamily phosphohydrolase